MTVSVVTISFNQAAFLERAILSVLDQTGVDIEYIVVDPGSTDGSRDIIARYAPRIATVILEPDAGAADGLNKGLAAATGDYFTYLNSDDEYLPGALAEAASVLEREPALDVVYASGWMVDAHGRRFKHLLPSHRFSGWRYARGLGTIVQQASVMRTAALRAAGGFNIANRTCWDGEAFFAMAERGARFRRVKADWALFRVHAGSITSAGVSAAFLRDRDRIFLHRFGRPMRRRDHVLSALVRSCDYLVDLRNTATRVAQRLGSHSRRSRR